MCYFQGCLRLLFSLTTICTFTTNSQRIPQSFFPLRQDQSTVQQSPNATQPLLPPSYLPAPPNYDLPNQRTSYQPAQQPGYQPIPYTPHQIPAYSPVQNLNQIGNVDPIQPYDQANPYGNRPPNYEPINQAAVPIVNDPTVVQIAQYSNPQIPEVFRNSLLNGPNINQLNYNLIAPQNPTVGGASNGLSPLTPSGYAPNPLPPSSLGNVPVQGTIFQPYNPYAGLFNESNQKPQQPQNGGYPQQLPHFSYGNPQQTPNSNGNNVNHPFQNGQNSPAKGPGSWFQSNPSNNDNGGRSGPTNLHNLPSSGGNSATPHSVPPLNIPQLPNLVPYSPPQLPSVPSPTIPNPPANFLPPPLSNDPTVNYLPLGPPTFLAGIPPSLASLANEEIPWDENLLSKGNIQHRSSEMMSAPLKFDVASFLSWILPGKYFVL